MCEACLQAQQGPQNVEALIALLENHQVTVSLMKPEVNKTLPWNPRQEREPPKKYPEAVPVRPLKSQGTERMRGLCKVLWHFDASHVEERDIWPWDCLGREELVPTASTSDSSRHPCHFLTICWAHEGAAASRVPVKIGRQDTEAIIDSGSMVTLIRPEFAGPVMGREISVSSIHGSYTRSYPNAEVTMVTPQGQFQLQAGVLDHLPVPVLVGRDCQAVSAYWMSRARERKRPTRRRRRDHLSNHHPSLTTEEITDEEATSPEEPLNDNRGEDDHSDPTATASEDPDGVQALDDRIP